VLIVPIQQAHYLMGGDPLLLSFIVVIIGGLGSLPGTVVAAILIGLSDGIISVFFSPTLAKILATLLVAWCWCSGRRGFSGRARMSRDCRRCLALHGGLIALLFGAEFRAARLSPRQLARIMVLASFAIGYNILFGYTGLLLSLAMRCSSRRACTAWG
jgi:ABC-type branched-subunit amino acid transport system permease subunit